MLAGLDGAWSKELYPAYKQTFVVSGQASPEPDGRTMVLDRTGATGLSGDALNLVATGFGMVVARQFSDDALYAELEATWTLNFGAPEWTADGTQLRRTFPLIPLMIQNGFPLLARSTTDELNLATLSQLPWQPERFAQPFLESVAGGMVFVNQAFYDAQEDSLILTINGGEANAGAAVLTVAQLSPDETYTVRREAELYDEWRWDDDKLLITTPHLSPAEETYVVTLRRGVSDEDEGCASSPLSSRTGVGFALVLLAGVLFAMQRRHA